MKTIKCKRIPLAEIKQGMRVVVSEAPDTQIYTIRSTACGGRFVHLVYSDGLNQQVSGGTMDYGSCMTPSSAQLAHSAPREDHTGQDDENMGKDLERLHTFKMRDGVLLIALQDLRRLAEATQPYEASMACIVVANLIASAGHMGSSEQQAVMDLATSAGFTAGYYAGQIKVSYTKKN